MSSLATRIGAATACLAQREDTRRLRLGYFGAGVAAAAALVAASERSGHVAALASCDGELALAHDTLRRVTTPTLLVVGDTDPRAFALSEQALHALGGPKRLVVVPGARRQVAEPGTLDEIAGLAADWFHAHLVTGTPSSAVVGEPW